jgi:hypothetical protein
LGDSHVCDPIFEIKNASIKLKIFYKLLNRMTLLIKNLSHTTLLPMIIYEIKEWNLNRINTQNLPPYEVLNLFSFELLKIEYGFYTSRVLYTSIIYFG